MHTKKINSLKIYNLSLSRLNIKAGLQDAFYYFANITQNKSPRIKQAISLLMILCLFAVSTPAAPQAIISSGLRFHQDLLLSFKINNWFSSFSRNSSEFSQQETQEQRDATVTRIKIDLSDPAFIAGKEIPLVAIAFDPNDMPVSGVKFDWSIKNSNGEEQKVSDDLFIPSFAGEYTINVTGANHDMSTQIEIIDPSVAFSGNNTFKTENQQRLRQFDEWDVENIPEAHDIKNIRGNTPGKPKGKNNFNIVAPVLSIPGRGLDLNLSLNYNSLVWSKLGQDISYDMDKDWLAPGWSIGFGKIINMIGGGITQIDADGTRRFFSGEMKPFSDKVVFIGQSTDGTFIKAKTETSYFNGCYYNPTTYAKYPDGTTVRYGVYGGTSSCYNTTDPITMAPNRIQDRNGNQIDITYYSPVNNAPGRWINTISDTLGRVYTFNYTLDNGRYLLTSITGQGLPDENGVTVQRTFVRLGYRDLTIAHNFTGLTPHVRENTVKVLSAIYYPATQSGYWFGDTSAASPSYSSYGMIRKVQEQKGMIYTDASGITSTQQITRERVYSYPITNSTAINDVPTFSTVTESWEGMTTAAPTTTYQVNWDATPRTTTIISSDQSKVVETSYNKSILSDSDPEKAKDGITYKTEYFGSDSQLKASDEIDWELGYQVSSSLNSKILRPKKLTHSEYENGITLTKITENSFGSEYNQVTETKEIGYAGPADVLRRSVTEFTKFNDISINPDDFIDGDAWRALPRLINLPTKAEIFENNSTTARIGYAKYDYDLNPLQAFSGANPTHLCSDMYCSAITARGNLSKTTVYENAATLAGAISDNIVYDKAGNLVEYTPEISANNKSIYTYTLGTNYAFPEIVSTGGNGANTALKATATYNNNTGLLLTTIDPDLQEVKFKRDPETWKLTETVLPTGGHTVYSYNDVSRTYSQTTYTANNSVAGRQLHKINGLGQIYRQQSFAKTENVDGQNQDVWDVTEIEYDQFGRTKKTSNPFRSSNDTTHATNWSEVFYDTYGRVWKTVSPDGSAKYNYYNEAARPQGASAVLGKTVRMVDPIGREKWYRTDSDGNMAEVIEPNPDGNGAVTANGYLTAYSYDRLNRLTQTTQGSQLRKFRYDSLGRLLSQKMAETKATLDDNGMFVGEQTGLWSDNYKYDKLSNVTTYTDARGVKTNYSYINPSLPQFPIDPLNRLFSISYDVNGATDVLPSATINFAYQSSGNVSQPKSVTTTGVSTVEFGYDTVGRINEKKTTLLTRPDNPMTVNYFYDSLNRMTDVTYPTPHGTGGTRKNVHYDFDAAGHMNNLKVGSTDYASDFVFNAFDQVTSVKIGPTGANQINETYNYSAQTGLLENQKVLRGSTSLLDLSYEYQRCACSTGGTGQITKITNNLDRNKDRGYEYDALSRVKKVTGGINQGWSQAYVYDRYGNRTNVDSLGTENRNGTNASEDNQGTKNKQKKIITDSLLISSPNAKQLLSNIKRLTSIEAADKKHETPVSPDKQLETTDATANEPQKTGRENQSLPSDNSDTLHTTPIYKPFDFDGDGKADYSVFQRSSATWTINRSGNNQTTNSQFGVSSDQIAPADYDGDGKADIAVFRPSNGTWYILRSSDNVFTGVQWGQSGDAIAPADYDGDGKADVAIWHPSNGYWYILRSSDGALFQTQFGGQQFGDIPVVGDYDGDAKADIAVWRPSTGFWFILQSSTGQMTSAQLGSSGVVPVPADYDGDGKTDVAVWLAANGIWYITKSSTNQTSYVQFGAQQSGDLLVTADYDGDGKADIAVWRASTGAWYVLQSSNGAIAAYQLGTKGDIPIPSAYIRRSSAPINQSKEVPRDGLAVISYDLSSNRITNAGFEYDFAGNQTRKPLENGGALRFQYDAAGRLVKIKNDSQITIVTYTYGSFRERLVTQEGDENSTLRTYYAWEGGAVISEYVDSASNTLVWTKNYIFMGGALLATQEQTANGERVQFDHPDQLGTRIITDAGTSFEQNTLPFGTALDSESTGAINRRFTSYDRSTSTGLDYATNRFYDSSQGRFTQVDPIAMSATRLTNPQTLNLYAYCNNDPVNHTDPDGLDANLGIIHTSGGGTGSSGGGYSLPAGVIRFLQGIFGNIFGGSYNYAGMVVPGLFNNPATFISATDRYGLPNAGETKAVVAPLSDICDQNILTKVNVKDESSDGAPTKYSYLNSSIVDDFNAAISEIQNTGFNRPNDDINQLGFTELFRTYEHQDDLYKLMLDRKKRGIKTNPAAPPGTSNHEGGFSFDIKEKYIDMVLRNHNPKVELTVEQIFNNHGFFRNVMPSDKVHFTHKSAPDFKGRNASAADKAKRNKMNAAANEYFKKCL